MKKYEYYLHKSMGLVDDYFGKIGEPLKISIITNIMGRHIMGRHIMDLTSEKHIRELLLQFLNTGNKYYKTHLIDAVVYKLFGFRVPFYQSGMVRKQITGAFQELIIVIYAPYFPLIFRPKKEKFKKEYPTLAKSYGK